MKDKPVDIRRILFSDEAKVFIFFFILYAAFTQNGFGANEGSRLALTRSLGDNGSLEISRYLEYTMYIDYSKIGDKAYSDKAPGSSFLALPIYLVAKLFSVTNLSVIIFLVSLFTSGVFSALTCSLLYSFSGFLTKSRLNRVLVTASYGLGTIAFPFATVFFGHSIGAFFSFAGFYALFLARKKTIPPTRLLALSGTLLGASYIVEYQTILIALVLFLYLITFERRPMRLLSFIFPIVFFLLLSFSYNYLCSGNPLVYSYIYHAAFKDLHVQGFNGVTYPKLDALEELLSKPERGILFYSPVLVFSLIGLLYSFKSPYVREALVCLCVFIVMLLFNASFDWRGGWSYGPRYLVPMLPFICLLLCFAFEHRVIRYIGVSFITVSFIVNFAGAATNVVPGSKRPIPDAINGLFIDLENGRFAERAFYFQTTRALRISLLFSSLLLLLVPVVIILLLDSLSHNKKKRPRLV